MTGTALWRRVVAEFFGTAALVTVVVGSGIAAQTLSPNEVGVQLLENSLATTLGLAVLIAVLGPVSGAHFNPVVTLVLLRRAEPATRLPIAVTYIPAQIAGAVSGAVLANLMFGLPAVSWSTTSRDAPQLWLGEVVATAGLIVVILGLLRSAHDTWIPAAVGAYIGAAYWFTSSTSFANPAVTIGRAFTDTFAGIAPASIPGFLIAQCIGALVGVGLVLMLFQTKRLDPAPVETIAATEAELESRALETPAEAAADATVVTERI